MKLMASLAPARAEIEAGVVAKADQLQKLITESVLQREGFFGNYGEPLFSEDS